MELVVLSRLPLAQVACARRFLGTVDHLHASALVDESTNHGALWFASFNSGSPQLLVTVTTRRLRSAQADGGSSSRWSWAAAAELPSSTVTKAKGQLLTGLLGL